MPPPLQSRRARGVQKAGFSSLRPLRAVWPARARWPPSCEVPCWGLLERVSPARVFTEERDRACSCLCPSLLSAPLDAGLLRAASVASRASMASMTETPLDGGPDPPWPSLRLSQVSAPLAPHDPCAAPAQGPSSRALLLHPSTGTEESEPAWDPDGGDLAKEQALPQAL